MAGDPPKKKSSFFGRLKEGLKKFPENEKDNELKECEKGEKKEDEKKKMEKDDGKEEKYLEMEDSQNRSCCSRLQEILDTANTKVVSAVENVCGWWGSLVATHPVRAALIALLLVGLCTLGFLNFNQEERSNRLWFSQDSNFVKVHIWQTHNFPRRERKQRVLWAAEDNILTARAMQAMLELHQRILRINQTVQDTSVTWQDICARVRTLPTYRCQPHTYCSKAVTQNESILVFKRRVKEFKKHYCPIVEALPEICYERSILEIWKYDPVVIMNLTDNQVLLDINQVDISPVFGLSTDFRQFLGGVEVDATGRVIRAGSAIHNWVTMLHQGTSGIRDQSNDDLVSEKALAWEETFVAQTLDFPATLGYTPVPCAAHSLWKESEAAIMSDIRWVVAGWVALLIYIMGTLGRPLLAIVGMFNVGLAVAASYGLCSALTVPYGTINSILPILLLGLGVDDMYVIVAAWDAGRSNGGNMAEVGKRALGKAGVAITFTSLTDILAFLVGSSTKLPALRWFCIYAATGIVAVFLLQTTIFLAALTVDQCRKDARVGVVPSCQQLPVGLWVRVMRQYAAILVRPRVAVTVVVAAGILAGVGSWGATGLRLEYQPKWLLSESSYLTRWFALTEEQFPKTDESGVIYFANVSLLQDMTELHNLVDVLKVSPYIKNVDAWFSRLEKSHLTWDLLKSELGIFLHTPEGARYTTHFAFQGPLQCGVPTPPFSAFKIGIKFQILKLQHQAAMQEVQGIVAAANVSGNRIVWADAFNQWETERHLGKELWQSLCVMVGVVGAVTLVVVGVGVAAVLVVGCVAATLVEAAALMYVWGLTIDTLTTIALVLAGGLCVDYAAHIAYAFLAAHGTRQIRAQSAVAEVGTPIFHAGVSTLLAFLALGPSDSHLFQAFFKIFTGVSMLGLVNGLMVLPAMLSLLGPRSRTVPP